MKRYLREAEITGEKLTHLAHTEDLLLSGEKATELAVQALYAMYDTLRGQTPRAKLNTTLKIDGSPSSVSASDYQGRSFVATKGFFAKDRKIAYTAEDCQTYFGHAPDLAKKMTKLLAALPAMQIPAGEIWQGDFLFDGESLKQEEISGEKCVTFHPNTIVYAVPLEDPVAQKIVQSDIGIAWHTRYTGPDFDHLKISFDADVSRLQEVPGVFCIDAKLPSIAGKVTLTAEETAAVEGKLKELVSLIEECKHTGILKLISENEEINLYLNTFENFVIKSRMKQLDTPPEAYIAELRGWVEARYNKEIETKKQPKTKDAYAAKRDSALLQLDTITHHLIPVLNAQKIIVSLKELFIKKLDSAGTYKTLFKTLDRGYIPTGHEGYAVSDVDGNIQKWVSRLEFSFGNWSKDIVKGWMSSSRTQEGKSRSYRDPYSYKQNTDETLDDMPELKKSFGIGNIYREDVVYMPDAALPQVKDFLQQLISKAATITKPVAAALSNYAGKLLGEDPRAKALDLFFASWPNHFAVELKPRVLEAFAEVDSQLFIKLFSSWKSDPLIDINMLEMGQRYSWPEMIIPKLRAFTEQEDEIKDLLKAIQLTARVFVGGTGKMGPGEVMYSLLLGGSKGRIGDIDVEDFGEVEVKVDGGMLKSARLQVVSNLEAEAAAIALIKATPELDNISISRGIAAKGGESKMSNLSPSTKNAAVYAEMAKALGLKSKAFFEEYVRVIFAQLYKSNEKMLSDQLMSRAAELLARGDFDKASVAMAAVQFDFYQKADGFKCILASSIASKSKGDAFMLIDSAETLMKAATLSVTTSNLVVKPFSLGSHDNTKAAGLSLR